MEFKKGETRMLHQLIELARAGKKFRAKRIDSGFYDHGDFSDQTTTWTVEAITDIWQYKEIKEPRVVEFNWKSGSAYSRWPHDTMLNSDSTWKVVATEVTE